MVNKAIYCKNCGFVSTECDVKKEICPICKNKLYKTSQEAGYFVNRIEKSMPTWEDVVRHKYLKNIIFDKEISERRSGIEYKKQQDELRKLKSNSSKHEKNKFVPKCPTCGSTNIKKISATSKVIGAATFGLFSRTAKSQFHCNNCGYMW